MLRSSVALIVLAILPSFVQSQEPVQAPGTLHEVVRGETLWDLAEAYLGNPFRWPLIHQANLDQIQNPHLIYPGQELVIPRLEEELTGVQGVVVAPEGVAEEEAGVAVEEEPVPHRAPTRTVFYSPTAPRAAPEEGYAPGYREGSGRPQAVATLAVPPGLVYAAEWLETPEAPSTSVGVVLLPSEDLPAPIIASRARLGEELLVRAVNSEMLRRGDLLVTYRPVRRARKLGTVQMPTGILVVSEVMDTSVRTLVSHQFHRIQDGDRAGFLPVGLPGPEAVPTPVSSNVVGTVLAFAGDENLHGYGARAFLDVGAAEGIVIGDVFRVLNPASGEETARLQVVRVEEKVSTARVVNVVSADLTVGDPVTLVAKMQ